MINKKKETRQKIRITEKKSRGRMIRFLLSGGAIESAAYTESGMHNELVFPYLRQLSLAFGIRDGIRDTLLLGGGGFAYPRYYLSHYPERRMDVVEIDPRMIRISRKYFYLNELLRAQGLAWESVMPGGTDGRAKRLKRGDVVPEGTDSQAQGDRQRFRIFNEDAFDYLLRCRDSYDFIIDDVFAGRRVSAGLRSDDGIRLARARLRRGGIYAVNSVSALKGPFAFKGRTLERLLKRHFRYTAVIPCSEDAGRYLPQNCLMFASDEPL